jgi:ATP-binding cassette, subfamily B, bacterial
MSTEKDTRKSVWLNIFRLVQPFKKGLLSVFIISLMATGVTLIEPLIYREAVNDIAGLFVPQSPANAAAQQQTSDEDSSSPLSKLFDKWIGDSGSVQAKDSTYYTNDTIQTTKDTIVLMKIKHHHLPVKHKEKIAAIRVVKEPHTATRVAPRTPRQAFDTLVWSVIWLFVINIVGLIFWRIGENMNVTLSCTIEKNFIQRTFGHVLRLPLSFFAKHSSAALHKQIDQSEEISATVTYITKDIFPEVVSLIGILGIMFWQNYILTLLALSIVPFYLWLTVRSTRRLEMSLSGYYEKWEEVSARMQDALGGVKTVKLSGAEDREVQRLAEQSGSAYKDYMDRSFLSNKYVFWQIFLTHISTSFVLAYGGYLALNHRLTPGDVVMFITYLDMLYSPIDNLASIWAEIQQNVTSVARAFRLLDTEVEEKKGADLVLRKGKIEFRDVHFGYTPEREVLKGLSFTALPGKITAVVGTSGAGKTTTIDLLLKLFEPQSGSILIDGTDIAGTDEASIRRNVGIVSADGAIFRGTLADNIRYKKPDATDEEVHAAVVAAGMQATLQRFPDGLQTKVGESGFGLSVGERQRVQIARVIVDRPRILVMDEATANLDYATEAEVRKTIEEIRKENTVIIIAHRYSMVKDADHVIVLDDGKVAEEGTPAELIELGGWFADFANAVDEDTYEEEEEGTEEGYEEEEEDEEQEEE